MGEAVRIAYLRGEISEAEMQTAMVALEDFGCERVVVDSAPRYRPESRAALDSFIGRMKSGDDLVVTRLDQLASSTPRLLELLGDLIERGITVETLAGEFDTGQPETASTVRVLWEFEKQAREGRRLGRAFDGEASPGRPRRLAPDAVARARELIDVNGRPVSEVARTLGVSRATLYRSLKRV